MDQEIERRLARAEKRASFGVVYGTVALIWVIAQPEAFDFARGLGLSPNLTQFFASLVAGGLGAVFAVLILRQTST